MIFKQILFFISYLYFSLAYSYLFLTPSVLISNKIANKLSKFCIKLSQSLTRFGLIDGFKADFHLVSSLTNIKDIINQNPETIDILVCNHVSSIDHLILQIYLEYIGILKNN